ncbi:DUF1146 domain-containing protein [Erysipelothrix sp. D19-032]|uniref:DUF1146 domain-containing protein n=2 Tax=Erysipelotrichaceae TaxID=128827 RepID=UPI0013577E93|nr:MULTISPECIES: DUF1146 domain-containing protein [Erysipelothrix]QIK85106.1 DUF1146 domain-containing protein [Erysipelothrix sp. HDW6B]
MSDYPRIILYLMSFFISAYALYGVDFRKFTRKGKEMHMQVLYILLALALGYAVAQFLLGLSTNYLI